MAQHARLKIEAGVRVYFCDPHSPWQRGTNENTNGLLFRWISEADGSQEREEFLRDARHRISERRLSHLGLSRGTNAHPGPSLSRALANLVR